MSVPIHPKLNRRDGLKLGLGAFLTGGLAGALRAQAHATDDKTVTPQANSCILIWLDGGPTHYETFDPKPDAPVEIRGEFNPIKTKLSGVLFSKHMTRLASIADQFSVIRSIRHDQGNHGAGNHYMMTGAPPRIPVGCGAFVSFHPSMGSAVSHEIEAPHSMPAYFSLGGMTRSGGPNFLGQKHGPFVITDDVNNKSFRVRDVALPHGIETGRFGSRKDLRKLVDRMVRLNDEAAGDPVAAADEFYEQSYNLVASKEAQAAFDIHQEPEEVRQKYGRNPFGQRALMARRLVEAGVPFITLNEGGWDHHSEIFPALNKRLPFVDNTVATLIEDLSERGMLETTMVIVLGEFGRTPKINDRGGRDHWSNAMSVLFAGGGSPGGTIIGATDRQGYSAVDRVLSPENFVSTVYRKLGMNPNMMLRTPEGRPVHLVSNGTPIRELM